MLYSNLRTIVCFPQNQELKGRTGNALSKKGMMFAQVLKIQNAFYPWVKSQIPPRVKRKVFCEIHHH